MQTEGRFVSIEMAQGRIQLPIQPTSPLVDLGHPNGREIVEESYATLVADTHVPDANWLEERQLVALNDKPVNLNRAVAAEHVTTELKPRSERISAHVVLLSSTLQVALKRDGKDVIRARELAMLEDEVEPVGIDDVLDLYRDNAARVAFQRLIERLRLPQFNLSPQGAFKKAKAIEDGLVADGILTGRRKVNEQRLHALRPELLERQKIWLSMLDLNDYQFQAQELEAVSKPVSTDEEANPTSSEANVAVSPDEESADDQPLAANAESVLMELTENCFVTPNGQTTEHAAHPSAATEYEGVELIEKWRGLPIVLLYIGTKRRTAAQRSWNDLGKAAKQVCAGVDFAVVVQTIRKTATAAEAYEVLSKVKIPFSNSGRDHLIIDAICRGLLEHKLYDDTGLSLDRIKELLKGSTSQSIIRNVQDEVQRRKASTEVDGDVIGPTVQKLASDNRDMASADAEYRRWRRQQWLNDVKLRSRFPRNALVTIDGGIASYMVDRVQDGKVYVVGRERAYRPDQLQRIQS